MQEYQQQFLFLSLVYLINLIDQREPTQDVQKQDENSKFSEHNKIFYFKKIVEPNKDELLKHKEFLKKDLKKNYFN